jgi:hypothetical protein
MSLATWQETIINAQVDGSALTNTTTPTSLLPAASKFTLPTNFFSVIGKVVRVTAHGRISTVVTSPGNFTFDLRFGATAVMSSGAIPLNIVAKTNVPWFYQMVGTLRAIGASANFMPGGFWLSEAALNVAVPATGPGPGGNTLPYNTAPVVGSNFDSTASQVIDFYGTWGTANGSNSITLHQFLFEALN